MVVEPSIPAMASTWSTTQRSAMGKLCGTRSPHQQPTISTTSMAPGMDPTPNVTTLQVCFGQSCAGLSRAHVQFNK